jgi:hypothetical protein
VDYTDATDSTTDSVVDGADVGGGETWTCEVVADDSTDFSTASSSSVEAIDPCTNNVRLFVNGAEVWETTAPRQLSASVYAGSVIGASAGYYNTSYFPQRSRNYVASSLTGTYSTSLSATDSSWARRTGGYGTCGSGCCGTYNRWASGTLECGADWCQSVYTASSFTTADGISLAADFISLNPNGGISLAFHSSSAGLTSGCTGGLVWELWRIYVEPYSGTAQLGTATTTYSRPPVGSTVNVRVEVNAPHPSCP